MYIFGNVLINKLRNLFISLFEKQIITDSTIS